MDQTPGPEINASSSFHRLMNILDTAFRGLGKAIDPMQIESLASLLHQAMSQRGRRYHAMPHIFEIISGAGPIEQLAIVFHDAVYVQVDHRLHPKLKTYLKEFNLEDKTQNLLLPEIPKVKKAKKVEPPNLVEIAYTIFGVKPGNLLTHNEGENEFLSAVAAARILENLIEPWQVIQVLACIEATIPFRSLNAEGQSPSEILYLRLEHVNQQYALGKTKEEIQEVVRLSVKVSNRDVIGFASEDPGYFLAQTWELLLEGNPIFRNPLYTTIEYRSALQKIEGFFSFLKPPIIFREYEGEPNSEQYKKLLQQAYFNLSIGIEYIQTKLVGVAIHEAVSNLSGGDGPLVVFRGDIPSEKSYKRAKLDTYLDHTIPLSKDALRNPAVTRLLTVGRSAPDGFDFLHSTLGGYLYERMDEVTFAEIIKKSKGLFAGNTSSLDFLAGFPKAILLAVLNASAHVAWSRRASITELLRRFNN